MSRLLDWMDGNDLFFIIYCGYLLTYESIHSHVTISPELQTRIQIRR